MTETPTWTAASLLGRGLQRLLLAAALWWLLVEGSTYAPWLGIVAVVLAVLTSLWLGGPGRYPLRLRRVPGFAVNFLGRSIAAGVDVARRTLSPGLPLYPAVIHYHTWLPPGLPRLVLINLISLMPGTLVAETDGVAETGDSQLSIHCLDHRQDLHGDLAKAERQVALLFGLQAGEPGP